MILRNLVNDASSAYNYHCWRPISSTYKRAIGLPHEIIWLANQSQVCFILQKKMVFEVNSTIIAIVIWQIEPPTIPSAFQIASIINSPMTRL